MTIYRVMDNSDNINDDNSTIADGYMQAMRVFEQRIRTASNMQSVLISLRGNNDAIVGVMAAMASMGIGGRASLHGLEAATDADLSYVSAMEEAEAAKGAASRGLLSSVIGWLRNKWNSLARGATALYAKCIKWDKQLSVSERVAMQDAIKSATVAKDVQAADAAYKEAESALAKFTSISKADLGNMTMKEHGEFTKGHDAAIRNKLKLESRAKHQRELFKMRTGKEYTEPAIKKGWSIQGIRERLSKLINMLKPSNLKNAWSKASASATSAATKTGVASNIVRHLSGLSKGWWVAIIFSATAIIGTCVSVWKAYRKADPDGAEAAEKEGIAAEQQALRAAA